MLDDAFDKQKFCESIRAPNQGCFSWALRMPPKSPILHPARTLQYCHQKCVNKTPFSPSSPQKNLNRVVMKNHLRSLSRFRRLNFSKTSPCWACQYLMSPAQVYWLEGSARKVEKVEDEESNAKVSLSFNEIVFDIKLRQELRVFFMTFQCLLCTGEKWRRWRSGEMQTRRHSHNRFIEILLASFFAYSSCTQVVIRFLIKKTSLNNFFFFFFLSFIAIVEDKLNSRFYHTRQSQGL